MRDLMAAFYDPYSAPYHTVGYRRRRPRPFRWSRWVVAILVASAILIGLVIADATAYYALPIRVTITQVDWSVGNLSVGNQSGFTVTAGQAFTESVVCTLFCPLFTGATVNAPFAVVNMTVAYPWYEYANVTLRAPTAAYQGPLEIDLTV